MNGGNNPMSQMTMAQHPLDKSIWAFSKRDGFYDLIAFHFTELSNNIVLDWTKADYINPTNDGINGPQGEFPFLPAVSDPTRNAILLAYQTNQFQIVYVDRSEEHTSELQSRPHLVCRLLLAKKRFD